MSEHKLTGIILAGGKSSRMGYEKGLVLFNGKPMIEYSISVFSQLCNELIICSNHSCYNYLGYKVVPDIVPDCGPVGGLYSGLMVSHNELNLIAPCDAPFITIELYTYLLQNINKNNAVIPSIDGEINPLFGIYSSKCISLIQLLLLDNKYKMLRVVEELGAKIIAIKNNPEVFININTYEDLIKFSLKSPIQKG